MIIHVLHEPPSDGLGAALEKFERTFSYPLGAGMRFSISHGEDYPRFFRAISSGASASLVATHECAAPLRAPGERSAVGAREAGDVLGTLGLALRQVRFPNEECRLAAYLGDLKTAPGPGRGRILLRLATEAARWSIERGAVLGYGVVMDGTLKTPVQYTGRIGMHAFREVGKIFVLRLPAGACGAADISVREGACAEAWECFLALSRGKFAPLNSGASRGGEDAPISETPSAKWHRDPAFDGANERRERSAGVPPDATEGEARALPGEDRSAGAPTGTREARALPGEDRSAGAPTGTREARALPGFPLARRSVMEPIPLLATDQSACGVLEDTRLAKRLIGEDGNEMLAAHLSSFAYENPRAGVSLIRHALAICARGSIAPAMFVAIPYHDLDAFTSMLGDVPGLVIAPATVYGTGENIPEGDWLISTSEI